MDKKPLIVVSLCAVVLLILGSLSNVVGYQTSQVSNHVEKDVTLNLEITQLQNSECDCENEITWHPVLCILLLPLIILATELKLIFGYDILYDYIFPLGEELNCLWAVNPPDS